MPRPAMRLSGPVLGSTDPLGLARFYERLLGWPLEDYETAAPGDVQQQGWAKIRSPTTGLKTEFQYEPYHQPPVEGAQQMTIHLDISVEDLAAGGAWAIAFGATLAGHQPQADVGSCSIPPVTRSACSLPGSELTSGQLTRTVCGSQVRPPGSWGHEGNRHAEAGPPPLRGALAA
jgi:Glyoxalase-like domain